MSMSGGSPDGRLDGTSAAESLVLWFVFVPQQHCYITFGQQYMKAQGKGWCMGWWLNREREWHTHSILNLKIQSCATQRAAYVYDTSTYLNMYAATILYNTLCLLEEVQVAALT